MTSGSKPFQSGAEVLEFYVPGYSRQGKGSETRLSSQVDAAEGRVLAEHLLVQFRAGLGLTTASSDSTELASDVA